MLYVYIAIIGLTAGLVKGLSGFGSSLVTIPLLTMVLGPERIEEIVVIMITFNVVLNLVLVKENKALEKQNFKDFYLIIIFGSIFTFVGIYGLKSINVEIINYVAASLILLAILVTTYHLFAKNKVHLKPSKFLQCIVGALSGLGNGLASIDGPPVVFYLLSTDTPKKKFVGTLASHFLVMGIIGVVSLLILGMYNTEILIYTGFMIVFTVIGLFTGIRINRRIDERVFKIVILVILVALDIKMLFF